MEIVGQDSFYRRPIRPILQALFPPMSSLFPIHAEEQLEGHHKEVAGTHCWVQNLDIADSV